MSTVSVLAIIGIVVVIGLVMAVGASRYKKAGPNEAFIATGLSGQKIVVGGGMFVIPVVQKLYSLSLLAHPVEVHRENIFTKNRIPIVVDAVLVYKVNGNVESIKLAAQSLQGKKSDEISTMIEMVAEGAFRDICGKMTPEEINENRDKFQNEVTTNAQDHFNKIGIDLISFVVTHISDQKKYFENLGVPASAEVDKEARIKRAEADRAAIVVEAEQRLAGEKRKAETEADIALAQKERDVKKAQYNAKVSEENAIASQSGPKAEARSKQDVVDEQTKLADKEAARKEKELLTTQVRPAEAHREAQVAEAEGVRKSTILRAEGDKTAVVLRGEAEGTASQKKGEGEAAAIKAKLIAEAEGLERKAKAMREFNEAGMGLQVAMALVDKLPEIIKSAASPLAAISKMEIIDFGGSGATGDGIGPVGKILNIPPDVLAKTDLSLKTTLGMGLADMIQLIRKGELPGVLAGATKTTGETAAKTKE